MMLKKSNKDINILDRLNKAISALVKIIKNENSLLEFGNFSGLDVILQKKVGCMNDLEDCGVALQNIDKDQMSIIEGNTKSKMTTLLDELRKESEKNDMLLKVNMEVSNQIVEIYKKQQLDIASGKAVYDSKGRIDGSLGIDKMTHLSGVNNKV